MHCVDIGHHIPFVTSNFSRALSYRLNVHSPKAIGKCNIVLAIHDTSDTLGGFVVSNFDNFNNLDNNVNRDH